MNDSELCEFMVVLLDNVQIYGERQPNGQWLKSIEFKLPIIKEDMKLFWINQGLLIGISVQYIIRSHLK